MTMKDKAFITALVRGIAFAVITVLFLAVPVLDGFLWCVYIGFFLTMAFGVQKLEYPNYVCSLLAGYVWAVGYVFGPGLLESALQMPHIPAMAVSELILTFLLIFVHVKFLHGTVLNKVPAVFAGVATIFASGGMEHTLLCAVSAVIGISMAMVTEIIIVRICGQK